MEVASDADNLHLTCESPLFRVEKKIAPKDALALQYHDPATAQATMILPPTMGAPAVAIAQEKRQAVRDMGGSGGGYAPTAVRHRAAEVSPLLGNQHQLLLKGLRPSTPRGDRWTSAEKSLWQMHW